MSILHITAITAITAQLYHFLHIQSNKNSINKADFKILIKRNQEVYNN